MIVDKKPPQNLSTVTDFNNESSTEDFEELPPDSAKTFQARR